MSNAHVSIRSGNHHLVIDGRCVRPRRTGVGNSVLRHLTGLRRLADSDELGPWRITIIRDGTCSDEPGFDSQWKDCEPFQVIDSPAGYARHPGCDWWQQVRLPGLLRRLDADVLFSPAYVGPVYTRGVAHLVMVHDNMVWTQPSSYPFLFRNYLRTMTRLTCSTADRVIFPSRDARRACASILRIPRTRLGVVPHGVDRRVFRPAPLQGRRPVVLCIASAERRKNHEALVSALADRKDIELRFIGFSPNAVGRLNTLERLAGRRSWTIVPHADEERIAEELRQAAVLALPSRGEGFGLPVLEGMASGIPLVLSDIAVFHEVAGEAAVYAAPDDHAAWSRALQVALERDEPTRSRVEFGLARVPRFSLEAAAKRLLREAELALRHRRGSALSKD